MAEGEGWEDYAAEREELAARIRAAHDYPDAPDRVVFVADTWYDLGTFEDPRQGLDALRVHLGQPPLHGPADD